MGLIKRLLLISLLIMGCGSGGPDTATIYIDKATPDLSPVLADVVIIDMWGNASTPPAWHIGFPWLFTLRFTDPDNDVDHAIGHLYDPDTMEPMWGPYIFDLNGATDIYSSSDNEPVIADHAGLYVVGFIIVDQEGNESRELTRDVKIIE